MHLIDKDVQQVERWRDWRAQIAGANASDRAALLHERAQWTRRAVVTMIDQARAGHIGGDFSVTDVLTVLFNHVLRIDPTVPDWPQRDRFILSKGHCAAALYGTLAWCGFFSPDHLRTFMGPLSPLNGHPNRRKVPGVETNTGPLGHGLPVGVGAAIGARLAGGPERVFVVLGDGEMQEGSNWEALMAASHYRLDNLYITIDRNRLQQGARTEETNGLDPLPEKLAAFGWEVREVDGHDYNALIDAYRASEDGSPVAVIANTTKGKGVPFIEDRVEWHHKVPSAQQVEQALKELA
ncbi:MAG: transketolase [Propioniciclava sp.]